LNQPRKTLTRALRDLVVDRSQPLGSRVVIFVRRMFPVLTFPLTVWFLFTNRNLHPAYGMTWPRLFALSYRLYANTTKVFTGTSYRAHLAMLAKLLEIPPEVDGVVVECGCYLGGSTANLSLICEAVGRELIVYDSFEGLPESDVNDRMASPQAAGFMRGALEEVQANVAELGAIDVCQLRKGWFSDTLPHHTEPIVLCFLDVDWQMSIHQCLVHLWPHLTDEGYLFTDDFPILDQCAVFYSEEFWRREFDRTPPGLIGAGSGVALGQYWVGPYARMGGNPAYPLQAPSSIAYTRKDFSGHWGYVPPDEDGVQP
jgi:O-methyltransferase